MTTKATTKTKTPATRKTPAAKKPASRVKRSTAPEGKTIAPAADNMDQERAELASLLNGSENDDNDADTESDDELEDGPTDL